jgi:hypothetical protein
MAAQSGKDIIVFPDITNEAQPSVPSALSLEIMRKAAGRRIIGMIGLEKRKGFLTMLRIAEAVAGREDWYFVAAGQYSPETCTTKEQTYLKQLQQRVASGELDNLHLEIPGERINDGVDFNSLIKTFDVIYAAYEDFAGSSNALTKGAIFERPLIATRGECVGDRVEQFGMGLTIAQCDVHEGEDAIRHVLAGEDWNGQPLSLQFQEYHIRHNRARLDAVFGQLLEMAEERVSLD